MFVGLYSSVSNRAVCSTFKRTYCQTLRWLVYFYYFGSMEVYAIYTGSIYEGGDVDSIYAELDKAVEVAEKMFQEADAQSRKVHDEDPERWAWSEDLEIPVGSFRERRWKNLVEEIVILKYPVL